MRGDKGEEEEAAQGDEEEEEEESASAAADIADPREAMLVQRAIHESLRVTFLTLLAACL